jgi:hypothetical protein
MDLPIKFVAAEAGFFPFAPSTFFADILRGVVEFGGVCAGNAADSGQWTSLLPLLLPPQEIPNWALQDRLKTIYELKI